MHSPVYINYDPALETASLASDWEYYSDEYWDLNTPKKRKRREGGSENAEATESIGHTKKRRKKTKLHEIPELSLREPSLAAPTVVWRSKKEILETHEGPGVSEGQEEKVSLLKDWRERFKHSTTSTPKTLQRKRSQRAIAVVIDRTPPEISSEDSLPLPPTTLSAPQGLPSRNRVFMSSTQAPPPAGDDAASSHSFEEDDSVLASEPASGPILNDKKRKAEDDIPTVDTADAPNTKRRPGRPKKQKTTITTEIQGETDLKLPAENALLPPTKRSGRPKKQQPSPLSKEPLDAKALAASSANKAAVDANHNESTQLGLANGHTSTKAKRKADNSEDESLMPPPKRQNSFKKGKKIAAHETIKEPVARRSTRNARA